MLKQNLSHYRQVMQPLIEHTLLAMPQSFEPGSLWLSGVAAEALIHPTGRQRYALSLALEQLTGNAEESLMDSAGHRRPIYFLLALHLTLRAWIAQQQASTMPDGAAELLARLADDLNTKDDPIDLKLWRLLCLADGVKAGIASSLSMEQIVQAAVDALTPPGRDGALHHHDPDESLDAWTYRELTGLHALHGLALVSGDTSLAMHARRIAHHHVENTQPDNTTNQPWALSAFLTLTDDTTFADQQLHDATTQGSQLQSGKAPGLVACLLLTDAWRDLSTWETKEPSQA